LDGLRHVVRWDAVVKSSPAHGAKLREMLEPK